MSRLTEHQQKEENKKIMYLIGGFVIFIIFFITVGFKLLINSAVFVNDVAPGAKKNVEQDSGANFYGTISVDNVPVATNSAKIYVDGNVNGFNVLEFFVNNTSVKKVSLGKKTQFSELISGLKKGENEVYIKASSTEHTQIKKTNAHTVFYKADKLTLEISNPTDGSTVNTEEITVTGNTDHKDTTIDINGQPVVVDGAGAFQKIIRLKEGENKLVVNAEDIGGNTPSKTITVNYQKDD